MPGRRTTGTLAPRRGASRVHPMEPTAERIRAALVQAALEAFQDAGVRGLCCEGAFEAAVAAMRTLDLGGAAGGGGASGGPLFEGGRRGAAPSEE